jgi:hypothetical protein
VKTAMTIPRLMVMWLTLANDLGGDIGIQLPRVEGSFCPEKLTASKMLP